MLIILDYFSWLLIKACFASEHLFQERALSNPTVPCQALTNNSKRQTTKIQKVKVISSEPKNKDFQPLAGAHCAALNLLQLKVAWPPHAPRSFQLKSFLKKIIPTPLTPPPPRAPPAGLFTSPTPPLVIGLQQGGGTSFLVPNSSLPNNSPVEKSEDIGRYWKILGWPARELEVSRVTCQV